MMRHVMLAIVTAAVLCGCTSNAKPPMLMTPQSRLIYHDGTTGLWTTCDRGNRVYMTHAGLVQVIPYGCLDGQP
jgi:hypothetical protein